MAGCNRLCGSEATIGRAVSSLVTVSPGCSDMHAHPQKTSSLLLARNRSPFLVESAVYADILAAQNLPSLCFSEVKFLPGLSLLMSPPPPHPHISPLPSPPPDIIFIPSQSGLLHICVVSVSLSISIPLLRDLGYSVGCCLSRLSGRLWWRRVAGRINCSGAPKREGRLGVRLFRESWS